MRLFQKCAVALLAAYFLLMVLVTVAAYSRKSGSTGMDMALVQKMRYESSYALPENTQSAARNP